MSQSHIPLFKGEILYANAYCLMGCSTDNILMVLLDCEKPYVKCAICAFMCKLEIKYVYISFRIGVTFWQL